MGLVTMIVNYSYPEDAIEYIKTRSSKLRVPEINEALKRFGINPKDYSGKYKKIEVLIETLEKENSV